MTTFANPLYSTGFGGMPLSNAPVDLAGLTNWGRTSFNPQNNINVMENPFGYSPSVPTSATSPDFWSLRGLIGDTGNPGWGSLALGSAQALGGLFMGMKQYGIAKKTLNENKRQFQLNWDANRNLTNAQLADRQAGRIAASGPDGRHASVADYMAQYGIK